MVDAVFLGGQHVADDAGQVFGIGGGADLVVDHTDLLFFLAQAEHGADEVMAVFAEGPAGAQDEVTGHEGADRILALDLAHAVDVAGAVRIVDLPGLVPGAGENVVRGDEDDLGADGQGSADDVHRAHAVDGGADFRLGFRLIHVGIGGAVDDYCGTVGKDIVFDGLGIGQVKILHVHTAAFNAPGLQQAHRVPAQLACVSGYEHFHHPVCTPLKCNEE